MRASFTLVSYEQPAALERVPVGVESQTRHLDGSSTRGVRSPLDGVR
jgi:hypothetical protein